MKKFIGLVVVLCILLCTLAVAANEPPHSNITWNIQNGTLTVKGAGAMDNYKSETEAPWYSKRNEITEIVVEDGITHIGNMAFYGIKNAKKAVIAESVKSVGICAFSYTEGTRTILSNPGADFQFTIESDCEVAREGDSLTLTVTLSGNFDNVSAVQTAIIYDKKAISIDESGYFDQDWLASVDSTNLGYISKPVAGFVANNLRIAYISLSGKSIDEGSPLYNAGHQNIVIAKVKAHALRDIEDVGTSVFMLKNSNVSVLKDSGVLSASSGENQLTDCTRLALPNLVIESNSFAVVSYANDNSISVKTDSQKPQADEITVIADGKAVKFDTEPFINQNGKVMIPLRAVLEKMGVSILWDGDTKTIIMNSKSSFAATQLGSKYVFKDQTKEELDEASVAKDSRTLVSLNFFEKVFGYDASWDENTKTVQIK